jgi:hypothetical protein
VNQRNCGTLTVQTHTLIPTLQSHNLKAIISYPKDWVVSAHVLSLCGLPLPPHACICNGHPSSGLFLRSLYMPVTSAPRMEAVCSFETLVSTHMSTRYYRPEDKSTCLLPWEHRIFSLYKRRSVWLFICLKSVRWACYFRSSLVSLFVNSYVSCFIVYLFR